MATEQIFWLDGKTRGEGGVFVRTEIGPLFEKMLLQGMVPIGIRIETGERNAEILFERVEGTPL